MKQDYEDCMLAAKAELSAARTQIQDQISRYPAPIAGCDAQFNHLLADRQRVLTALQALEEVVFVPTPRTPTPDAGIESR